MLMRQQNGVTVVEKFFVLSLSKGQQYDCKWYVPLADLTFQTIDDCESSPIPLVQDEEIDAMKIKISQIKNELQREKVRTDSKLCADTLRGLTQLQHRHQNCEGL